MESWFSMIEFERDWHLDDSGIVSTTLSYHEMHREFVTGEVTEVTGIPFTAWTKNRVYFPTFIDGVESVSSAPRNPCDEKLEHIGGE